MCWAGAFSYWEAQKLMVWRYGLVLAGEQVASPEQIDTMIRAAVLSSERFYPAFQLVVWGNEAPDAAMQVAMTEAYGRACEALPRHSHVNRHPPQGQRMSKRPGRPSRSGFLVAYRWPPIS